jgi:hypothetical protein
MASAVHCARRVFLIAAALFLWCGLNPGRADAKAVTMQFQDLKILYTAAVAGTMSTSIDLVLQDANGKALSKFQVTVSAPGYTVVYAGNGTWKLTGNTTDRGTATIKIASVAAYNGNISLQSAVFLNGANATGQGAVTGGKLAGDPTYEITDAVTSSPDLTVEDLMFYEDHAPVDLATLDPSVPIGGGTPETDAVLDAADMEEVDYAGLPQSADYPGYFLAQGEVFEPGGTTPVAWFVDGYTAAPEPSTWALMLMGFAGLAYAGYRASRKAVSIAT